MAKLQEEIIVVKVSTLLPDNFTNDPVLTDENIAALTEVLQQLAGNNRTLVEIEKA
jgi:hypothetical protein